MARLAQAACIAAALLLAGTGSALAAPGGTLDSFDATAAGVPACTSGFGTGIAYDGTNLLLSCWESNVIQRVSAASPHTYNGPATITGMSTGAGNGIGALSWDPTRGKLWACDLGDQKIKLIDMATSAVVANPAPIAVADCSYGIAYDPSDDTMWVSRPDNATIYHLQLNGTQIASGYTGDPADLFEGYPNSGIVAACGTLYVSNLEGNGVYAVPRTMNAAQPFYFQGSHELAGMAVDAKTFKSSLGVDALWIVDANSIAYAGMRFIYAAELPSGCTNSPPVCTAASVSVTPGMIWQSDHKFVNLTITGVTDPDGDKPTITPTGIRQDEVVKGDGEGSSNWNPDGRLSPLAVRAERNASTYKTKADGRVYTVYFSASDGKGGTCSGNVKVCVPPDGAKKKKSSGSSSSYFGSSSGGGGGSCSCKSGDSRQKTYGGSGGGYGGGDDDGNCRDGDDRGYKTGGSGGGGGSCGCKSGDSRQKTSGYGGYGGYGGSGGSGYGGGHGGGGDDDDDCDDDDDAPYCVDGGPVYNSLQP